MAWRASTTWVAFSDPRTARIRIPRPQVNPLEQPFPSAEQDRRDCDVQLIDQARTKILLDGVGLHRHSHVLPVRCVARLVKRLVNAACDEMECRVAFHLDGRTSRGG